MSANALDRTKADHQTAWENLPWYLNGTLQEVELAQLERHVRSCVACRGELQYLRELGGLVHTAEDFPLAPTQSLSSVMARIEAVEGAGAPSEVWPSVAERVRAWLAPLRRTAPGIRFALLAQAAMILLLVGTLAWVGQAPPAFRTLSDMATPVPDSRIQLRLVFGPATTELRIREILAPLGAEIVAGPTALGVYTVAVPDLGSPDRTGADLLEELRRLPEITFAELAAIR